MSQEPVLVEPRWGTGMLRRFGWFYKVLGFGRRLSHVRFEENSVDRIRDASTRGPLVYVLHHASSADHLALNAPSRWLGGTFLTPERTWRWTGSSVQPASP